MRMKFSNGSPLLVYSADEVRRIRKAIFLHQKFEEVDIDELTLKKMSLIVASYPLVYKEDVLALISEVTDKHLKGRYDFGIGCRYFIDVYLFPHIGLDIKKKRRNFVEYVADMLTVLGWNVSIEEKDGYFHLIFAPLLALEPNEVYLEIEKRVNRYAGQALQVINSSMIENIDEFTIHSLGIDRENMPSQFFELVVIRLRELLGPKWTLSTSDDIHFQVSPSTPS